MALPVTWLLPRLALLLCEWATLGGRRGRSWGGAGLPAQPLRLRPSQTLPRPSGPSRFG